MPTAQRKEGQHPSVMSGSHTLASLAAERRARGFPPVVRHVTLCPPAPPQRPVRVTVVERPGDAVGSVVWGSSMALLRVLAAEPSEVRGRAVLELGAGVGLCGIAAAALGARSVVLTDRAPQLHLLRASVEANPAAVASRCSVAALEWGCRWEGGEWGGVPPAADVVLAADVVYRAETLPALAETAAALCGHGATMLLAYQPRRPSDEAPFFDDLRRRGLAAEPVDVPRGGVDSPFRFAASDQSVFRIRANE